jgi:hypothetical protein
MSPAALDALVDEFLASDEVTSEAFDAPQRALRGIAEAMALDAIATHHGRESGA